MKMLIVSNKAGRIISAAHTPAEDSNVKWGFAPLRNQVLTEVAIPDHLKHLDEHERLKAVLKHKLVVKTKQLRPPRAR